ncbi:polysaccharide biosynthesis protein [Arcanobacterium haemolyticum]|nr:polysaccharide biosynthesis protein [Arcanobacterium haemolyticum]
MTVFVVRLSTGFDAAGVFALAMSISNLVIPVAEYRLRTLQVTDVHGEHTSRQYLGLRVITTSIALAIAVCYTLATNDLRLFPPIIIYSAGQLLITYTEGFHAIEQRYMRMDYIGISYWIQAVGGCLAFVAGIYFFNSLIIAVSFLSVFLALVVLFYEIPCARKFGSLIPQIDWTDAARTLVRLFPISMVNVALSIVTLVPRQFLTSYASEEALGIYASVAAPALIIQASATYLYTPVLGKLVELIYEDKKSAIKMLIRIFAIFIGIGVLASLAFLIAGDWLIPLVFGEAIRPYTYLIQPALVLSLITAFVWFANDLLLGLRNYLGCFLGGAAAASSTLIVAMPFTKIFGLNAPSATGIFASVVALVIMGYFFRKTLKRTQSESADPHD